MRARQCRAPTTRAGTGACPYRHVGLPPSSVRTERTSILNHPSHRYVRARSEYARSGSLPPSPWQGEGRGEGELSLGGKGHAVGTPFPHPNNSIALAAMFSPSLSARSASIPSGAWRETEPKCIGGEPWVIPPA